MVKTISARFLTLIVMIAALLSPACQAASYLDSSKFSSLTRAHPIVIDSEAGEVRILARLQPEAFADGWIKWTPGYHAVVWKEGKAAGEALLASYVSDIVFYNSLVRIGAVPGNNLTMAAWKDRNDPRSKAPEVRVLGTPLDVFVWWEGLESLVPLREMVVDTAGKGIDMRFGGNKALIPEWYSGCIACLFSCPGGKVSNHAYTIRDYVKGTTTFSVNWTVVPKGVRDAVVIFRKR